MAFPGRRMEERVAEAKTRQAYSDKLTPQQRIAILDERLGPGMGAAKERAKLQARIDGQKAKQAVKALDPENNFIIKVDSQPIAIQSISQLRRLGKQRGFDAAPLVKEFRKFKKGR